MREIIKPNGKVYATVEVDEKWLKIKLHESDPEGFTVIMDVKAVPQLRQILTEAEFFKHV